MKRSLVLVVLLGGLVSGMLLGAEPKKSGKPAPPPTIAKLGWLAGSWRMEKGGRVIDEHWMAPAAGVMLGMGRTVAKGRVMEHEFLQIREGPGGELFFIAQPSGQSPGTFQLKSISETEVVFENLQHDFPQRISYTFKSDNSLLAAIEGPGADGQVKRIEFTYQRVQP